AGFLTQRAESHRLRSTSVSPTPVAWSPAGPSAEKKSVPISPPTASFPSDSARCRWHATCVIPPLWSPHQLHGRDVSGGDARPTEITYGWSSPIRTRNGQLTAMQADIKFPWVAVVPMPTGHRSSADAKQYHGDGRDILLQGFHWESHAGASGGNTRSRKSW